MPGVLTIVPVAFAFTVAVMASEMNEAPFSVPTFHTPVELEYVPTEGVAETNVRPAPNVSVTVTVVDAVNAGAPSRVYVIVSPAFGFASLTVSDIAVATEHDEMLCACAVAMKEILLPIIMTELKANAPRSAIMDNFF
jgi:hypothetical protein